MNECYALVRSELYFGEASAVSYGIAHVDMRDNVPIILESVLDLSEDRASVENLVELCNDLCLDPIHMKDVVYDFISAH